MFDGTDQAFRVKTLRARGGNIIIENCRQLVFALGLPERPLRNVLFSGVKANCQQLMKMRDVQGFVLKDACITAIDPAANLDGFSSIMMLDVAYSSKDSTPVIIQ